MSALLLESRLDQSQCVTCRAEQVEVFRVRDGYPLRVLGRPVDLHDVRVDLARPVLDACVEDQVDAVVVLNQAVGAGADEVRGVHVAGLSRDDVESGLLVHLSAQRLAGVLPMVDATARKRPPTGDRGAARLPGEQVLAVPGRQAAAAYPLALRRRRNPG